MAKNNGNGGSAPKIPPTSAEQDAIRRAAKAGRKGSRGRFGGGETLFGSLENEARQQREAEARAFRYQQVMQARQHTRFTGLQSGSIAERYASAILDYFPYVEVPADRSKSRTKVAEEEALTLMSSTDLGHLKALELGCSAARQALNWAYARITQPAKALVSA